MDALTRTLLDDHQIMVDGLTAIRDGHQESVAFVQQYKGETEPQPLPKNTVQSLQLAETVATLALGGLTLDTYTGPLLRSMLLKYGDHQLGCPAELPIEESCTCSWSNILRSLVAKAFADVNPGDGEPRITP